MVTVEELQADVPDYMLAAGNAIDSRKLYYLLQFVRSKVEAESLLTLAHPAMTSTSGRPFFTAEAVFHDPNVFNRVYVGDETGWDNAGEKGGYYIPERLLAAPPSVERLFAAEGHETEYTLFETDGEDGVSRSQIIPLSESIKSLTAMVAKQSTRHEQLFRKHNTYRSFVAAGISTEISRRAYHFGLNALAKMALPENKRKGPRMMSVRNWKWGKGRWKEGTGRHCGWWATKRRPGRPALSAKEWMRRYRARRAKRAKTGVRPEEWTMKATATTHPRPTRSGGRKS